MTSTSLTVTFTFPADDSTVNLNDLASLLNDFNPKIKPTPEGDICDSEIAFTVKIDEMTYFLQILENETDITAHDMHSISLA